MIAGELEYPTHFQAANFVDTFDLGVGTRIHLLSNGDAVFKDKLFNGNRNGRDTIWTFSQNVTPRCQIEGGLSDGAHLLITRPSDTEFGGYVTLAKSRGNGIGSSAVVQEDDSLGQFRWSGDDGTNFEVGASIEAFVDGTPGNDNMPGRIEFATTPSGSKNPVRRLTIDSTGLATFGGLVEFSHGVKVTGGDAASVVNGIGSRTYNDQRLYIFAGGQSPAQFAFDGTTVLGFDGVAANKDPLTIRSDNAPSVAGNTNLINFQGRNTGNVSSTFGKFGTVLQENAGAGGGVAKFAFELNSGGGVEEKAYVGARENFFVNDTYIGGTTTRNTRELWESTLTEEQQEQLAAGTLAVPASVFTPGDGSFARQWWYDQQSAEDQALIDSGELEYPSHFQAANFVDTFDLGVTTNINLLGSSGRGEFSGGVKVTGGGGLGVVDGLAKVPQGDVVLYTNSQPRLFIGQEGNVGINDFSRPTALFSVRGDAISNDPNTYYGLSVDNNIPVTGAGGVTTKTVFSAEIKPITKGALPDATIYNVFSGINKTAGKCKIFQGYHAENTITDAGTNFNAGFYSAVINGTHPNFNFYAAGAAPNYFAGALTGGNTDAAPNWTINADGTSNIKTSDTLTVKDFGAKGDGTDIPEVQGGDGAQTSAINAALDWWVAEPYRHLHFPEGTYVILR